MNLPGNGVYEEYLFMHMKTDVRNEEVVLIG